MVGLDPYGSWLVIRFYFIFVVKSDFVSLVKDVLGCSAEIDFK